MTLRRIALLASASAAIALLAACSTTAAPVPSPSPSPTATSAPSQTSSAEPESRPLLNELVLTTGGLGPLELGTDPLALNPDTSIVELLPDSACEGGTAERWTAAYPERPLGNELRAFEVGRLLPGERIDTIQVYDPTVKTAAGLGPGMTIDQLHSTYPNAEFVVSGAGRDQWLLEQDSLGVLVADVWQDGTPSSGLISSLSIGLVLTPSYHPTGSCAFG